MAGGIIGQIIEAIMYGPEGAKKYARMSIAGVDPADPAGSKLLLPEHAFQFWPESIQDTIEVGWNFKEIPGASHALAQWAQNNGRTISFEVRLHRFMKPVKDRTVFDKILDPFGFTGPGNEYLKDMRPHNVDVESEIRYLRAFCYPSYGQLEGSTVAHPPPVALLCVPGVSLNETGSDVIMAVMTGCDVTYNLLFSDGKPRNATVALTFKQVVQKPGVGVMWRGIGKDGGPLNSYKFKKPDGARVPAAADVGFSAMGWKTPYAGGVPATNNIKPGGVS